MTMKMFAYQSSARAQPQLAAAAARLRLCVDSLDFLHADKDAISKLVSRSP